jgi:hypothetical protein
MLQKARPHHSVYASSGHPKRRQMPRLVGGVAAVVAVLVLAQAPEAGAAPPGLANRADFIRVVLEVRLSVEDVARATGGAADPLTGDKHLQVAPLVRARVKAKAIELGTDPDNIGLPTFSSELKRFKRDDKTYVGKMTIDFYLKRE